MVLVGFLYRVRIGHGKRSVGWLSLFSNLALGLVALLEVLCRGRFPMIL